jgi:hypothetical protein
MGVPSATMSTLARGCKDAVAQKAYADVAKRLHQGDNYYADTAAFAGRLEKDIEEKALLLKRLGLPNER